MEVVAFVCVWMVCSTRICSLVNLSPSDCTLKKKWRMSSGSPSDRYTAVLTHSLFYAFISLYFVKEMLFIFYFAITVQYILQCFDAVGWAAGRASRL